ncbi:MAG: type IV pilus assembly protein FimV [Burkholderiaceae bacterium]
MSALHKIALIVLAAACSEGLAVGLGSIQVQSALNQPLRVSIPLLGNEITNISELCPKGKVDSFDGVPLARTKINFASDEKPSSLVITTTQAINEPAVAIHIEIGCGTSVQRNYQILLDPLETLQATQKVQAVKQPLQLADVSINPVQSAPSVAPVAASTPLTPAQKASDAASKEVKVRAHTAKTSRKARATSTEQNFTEQSKTPEKKIGRLSQQHAKKVSRNVLRLSADVSPVDSASMLNGMKLSDSITVQGLETDPQKATELRAAQLRFAAIMRGEDPEQNAENETKAAQDKIQVLMKEADQIKQQSEYDRYVFEEEQKRSLHVNWFIGLGALLLVCVIAMIWLARRLHQVNKMNQRPFWDHYHSDEEGETESHDEHDDSPFSDTVVEFEDTSSLSDDDVSIATAEAEPSEHDATFGKSVDGRTHSVSKGFSAAVPPATKSSERSAETSAEILPLQKPVVSLRNRKRSEMIEVEEISDAMEEAEFWMSLRDPQRAISVLEHFGDAERPKSPMAWLYLLKLYREVDERSKFDTLLQLFKSHFNTKAPEWDAKPGEMNGKGLEDYPHLVNQICNLWGSDQVARYLEDLLFNNRSGQREGFDLPVYLDLILLANIAYEVFPPKRNGKPATVSHI